jgi:signal transduction histidine kinase
MEPHRGQVAWPVRLGMMPALVDGFSARAETASDLAAALMAGAAAAEQLDRMMVKLLSNAVKYTPRGGSAALAMLRAGTRPS